MKQIVSIREAVEITNNRVKPFVGERHYLATGGLAGDEIDAIVVVDYETKPIFLPGTWGHDLVRLVNVMNSREKDILEGVIGILKRELNAPRIILFGLRTKGYLNLTP